MAVGLIAQAVAHHMRLPGIVLFLFLGVILGPDVLNIIRPETLGHGLEILVGMSVAVILFEGGLNLSVRRLRREATVIRRLVTVGAVMTGILAALVAKVAMGWTWSLSFLFGSLVIVTGPTVIAPLVRRIRLTPKLATILEAEGVLIDPVGAIIAVVVLEEVLALSSAATPGAALIGIPSRLLLGAVIGIVGGLTIGFLIKRRGLVPKGLENVFTLGLALAFFELSNAILPESGIMQAAVAGIVVGNMRTHVASELREFKEQLTVMLVGMLFVLLAANVRLADVAALGWRAAVTIALLIFVVRPIVVAFCTRGTELTREEKTFISWLSPRGIVAAAVASLFAARLAEAGIEGGVQLQGLVFLVIASTVVIQGISGSWVAKALGIRLPTNNGYAITGAHDLGRALGRALRDGGHDVAFIDANSQRAQAAADEGFQVAFGSANDEPVLRRVDIEGRRAILALTGNAGVNLLVANTVTQHHRCPKALVAIVRNSAGVRVRRVMGEGHSVLFGRAVDVDMWAKALAGGDAKTVVWRWEGQEAPEADGADGLLFSGKPRSDSRMVALVVDRRGACQPIDETTRIVAGDRVTVLYRVDQEAAVVERLETRGWVSEAPVTPKGEPAPALPAT
ncbi:MAG: cation:proton antiporter [Longimicrobiales bacterium]